MTNDAAEHPLRDSFPLQLVMISDFSLCISSVSSHLFMIVLFLICEHPTISLPLSVNARFVHHSVGGAWPHAQVLVIFRFSRAVMEPSWGCPGGILGAVGPVGSGSPAWLGLELVFFKSRV